MSANVMFDKKIKYWKANLIDLSKRNRLLNFRETKTGSVKLIYPTPEDLLSILVQKGRGMTFKWEEKIFEELQERSLSELDFAQYRLNQSDLITPKNEADQNRVLNGLRVKSRTAFHEQGVNILYVAFGMLHWKEVDTSDKVIKSPLFLVPVEIERKSITDPFKLSIIEEEIVFNPTLHQKLHNDFGLTLSEIPDDLDDLDDFELLEQYKRIETKIHNLSGWRVTNEAYLGLFSFKKFIMYKDLENYYDLLKEHPIICALSGDTSQLPKIPTDLPTAEELDYEITPEETYQVLDADSSQQEAIIAAKRGVSFIVQGPPGTGKSQTIANIIAECLGADRTVLFVSAKMAALEVVKKRLDTHGLGQFCLELHSHKANKKRVITELGNTLDAPISAKAVSSKKIQQLSELQKLREKLNSYVLALHKKRTQLNVSAFQIHGELASLEEAKDLRFKVPNIGDITHETLETIDSLLDRLVSMGHVLDNYQEHPWKGCNLTKYTFEMQNSVYEQFERFKKSVNNIEKRCSNLAQLMSIQAPQTLSNCGTTCKRAEHLVNTPKPPKSWFNNSTLDQIGMHAIKAEDTQTKYKRGKQDILSKYSEDVYSLNIKQLYVRFIREYDSIFRIFKGNFRADMKLLKQYYKTQKLNYQSAKSDLVKMLNVIKLKKQISARQNKHRQLFGHYYNGLNTDWDQITTYLEWVSELNRLFQNKTIPDSIIQLATDKNERLDQIANMKTDKINLYINTQIMQQYDQIKSLFKEMPDVWNSGSIEHAQFNVIYQWADDKLSNIDKLRDWIAFNSIINDLTNLKLHDFVNKILGLGILSSEVKDIFYKGFYRHWLDYVYSSDDMLMNFNSSQHKAFIKRFTIVDSDLMNVSKLRLIKKLSSKRPKTHWVDAPSSEQSIIRREMNKKRRHKPIRMLFTEISNLLLIIKPCLLMSPLSVAQFIDPNIYKFDVVIFDEASQICPEDAIGAIMRGREAIVVGDNKQLPPTKFFVSSGLDEYDDESFEEIDEFESILDECNTIGLPTKLLMWHYRSKHEHLIAFSNFNFYMNRLNTFPSRVIGDDYTGVEFLHVENGVYDRGKSRQNRIEAKKVADLVFDHFRNHPDKSLGVVAFSEAQQMAIYYELERKRREDPSLEPYFNDSLEENFFVRNLENVQGDEREVMFFSVGYGKDSLGRMSLNFGPLNSKGGERRLNVAITRARSHVKLVSSVLPHDIDLSKTQSRGVHLLKNYMEYAQEGPSAMFKHSAAEMESDFDSPFEEEVYKSLIDEGFTVHKQVGCSGYKIDLTIVDKESPSRYLLGIECDGATYHSGKTARDRDRLRQQVLEKLGWYIHRIWSRDWIDNPKGEIEKIVSKVNNVKSGKIRKKQAPRNPGNLFVEDSIKITDKNFTGSEQENQAASETQNNDGEKNDLINLPGVKYYQKTKVTIKGEPQDFHKYGYGIESVLESVVKKEGPIHELEAARRVAEFWGMSKAGAKIVRTIKEKARYNSTIKIKGKFYWWGYWWGNRVKIRIPFPGDKPRDIELIPKEEIGEAVMLVVSNAFSLTRNDIITQTARVFGYNRTGEKVRKRIGPVITKLLMDNRLEKSNNSQLQIPKVNRCATCGHVLDDYNGLHRCPECDTYCSECGHYVDEDDEECKHCGTSFDEE